MSRLLTYGMVGGGPGAFIGSAHRRSIALDFKAKIVAGTFSRDREKSVQMAERLHIDSDRCYESYESMAREESRREDGIDFVVIVTPNHSHYDICKAFLNVGIHVVCDKPVTVSHAQAKELEELARQKDLLFMVTYSYTGHVAVKYARTLVDSGKIGEIRSVMAEFPQGWLAAEGECGGKQGAWRCDPKQSGGVNCLGDLGTHVENAVAAMTGLKIKKVLARMDTVVPGRVLDDNDMVMVEYENGATGMYWTSQFAIGHDNSLRVRIYGSKGTIQWFQETPEKITVVSEDGTISEVHRGHGVIPESAARYGRLPAGHPEGWFEAMGNLYRSFTKCILAKEDGTLTAEMMDYPTVRDGVDGLAFVEACLESNKNGNVWVEVK